MYIDGHDCPKGVTTQTFRGCVPRSIPDSTSKNVGPRSPVRGPNDGKIQVEKFLKFSFKMNDDAASDWIIVAQPE